MSTSAAGGASASNKGRELKTAASTARAARQAGTKVVRGKSETAYKKQAKAWEAGSVGEERAARKLDLLTKHGYTTLHDVLLEPGKRWNLDHLVFGPSGLYFVDAKNWRGTIRVRGNSVYRSWYAGPSQGRKTETMDHEVAKVRGMASHASARLGQRIQPVICLAGAKSRQFEGVERAGGVIIVSVDTIWVWLRDAKPVLPPEIVDMNVTLARRLFPAATPPAPEADWVRKMRNGD